MSFLEQTRVKLTDFGLFAKVQCSRDLLIPLRPWKFLLSYLVLCPTNIFNKKLIMLTTLHRQISLEPQFPLWQLSILPSILIPGGSSRLLSVVYKTFNTSPFFKLEHLTHKRRTSFGLQGRPYRIVEAKSTKVTRQRQKEIVQCFPFPVPKSLPRPSCTINETKNLSLIIG